MKSSLFFLFSFLIFTSSFAQDKSNIEHVIQSKAFGAERKIYVHLPDRYLESEKDTFMVVYALDAQSSTYWNMAKSNVSYLVDNYQVVPMIIVGIHTENRGSEFIPLPNDKDLKNNSNGTAHLLQQHFRNEVFPLIEKEYRVNDTRAIVGHSRGGAFISTTLFSEQNDLFRAYLGISPAMGYMNNQILHQADSALSTMPKFQKYLYCSHGDVGTYEKTFSGHVDYLDSLVQLYPNKSLVFERDLFKDTDHWTVVIPSWNNGLLKMSRHFWADQKIIEDFAKNEDQKMKPQIEAFYQEKEKNFAYSIVPDVLLINYFGSEFDEQGNLKRAMEMFEWALEVDPCYIRAHRNKGWVYRQQEEFAKAKISYEQALECLMQQKEKLGEERFADMKEGIESNIKKVEEEMR